MSAAHVIPVTSAKRIMPVMSAMPIKRIMIIIFCRAAKHTKRVLQACKQIQGRDVKKNKKKNSVRRIGFRIGHRIWSDDLLHAFFKPGPGHHDLMAAFKAFDPEVRARSHNFPLLVPAWVLLPEFDDISKTVPVRHQ
jgi:hypothetical protein